MEQAAFSLKDYRFDKVSMDFSGIVNPKIRLSIEPFGMFDPKNKSFVLTFIFNAFTKVNGTGESAAERNLVSVRCVADFEFQNIEKIEDIPSYFYSNSIAILFPYVRAFVSTVTLQANISPMMLPTMNLSSLQEELKKNTKVQ